MSINKEIIKHCIKEILLAIGENPDREGLRKTPDRVADMCTEVFEGIQYTNDDIVNMYNTCFYDDVDYFLNNGTVCVNNICCNSYCEHHISLIYNLRISVNYKPINKIIGLSKIARISDLVCKRLQIQERIASDILYIIEKITKSKDIFVKVEGTHSCMCNRGVKKSNSNTLTYCGTGIYENIILL